MPNTNMVDDKMYFGIKTAIEFWDNVVVPNYHEFYNKENHLNPRLAMNAAISAYHFHEWVYNQYIKVDKEKLFLVQESQGIGGYRKLIVENGCPLFWVFHDIANGSKHMALDRAKNNYGHSKNELGTWGGLDWGDIGGSEFGHDYFLITTKSLGNVNQYIFENAIRDFVKWWKQTITSLDI